MKKTDTTLPKNIDEYLAPLPEDVQQVLEKLRKTILQVAPNAEEVISYGMPAFKYHGMLVYFASFKKHCSFFPGSAILDIMEEELKPYKVSKGTLQFTVEKPLPVALVKKIVKLRMK